MVVYLILLLVVCSSFSVFSNTVSANEGAPSIVESLQDEHELLGNSLGETDSPTLTVRVAGIIRAILSFIGVLLVIIVIYAGFLWLTAGGTPEKVQKAKDWLINAVIGAAIVLAAYAITDFVIEQLIRSAGAPTT